MKKAVIILCLSLLFLASVFLLSCRINVYELWPPDTWGRYNPEQAGAELVQSANISDQVFVNMVRDNRHDIAVNGNYIYIRVIGTSFQRFNRNTLEHMGQIEIPAEGWFPSPDLSGGLVVTDDFAVMLINTTHGPPPNSERNDYLKPFLLFLDLEAGRRLDIVCVEEALGISSRSKVRAIIGYDKENGLFWFRHGAFNDSVFHFFKFDETRSFIPVPPAEGGVMDGFTVGPLSFHHADTVVLHGRAAWAGFIGNVWDSRMERRCLDNPLQRPHAINLEFLGLNSQAREHIPLRFAFDGEYIFLAVRDRLNSRDITRLLKLRPKT